jgi:hypothetical protein
LCISLRESPRKLLRGLVDDGIAKDVDWKPKKLLGALGGYVLSRALPALQV